MKNIKEKGQSTIEFIMTFTASVGFIFLFLKIAINYTNGYMVHHATFLASRAYLTNDAEREDLNSSDLVALKSAEAVFKKYLPEDLITGFDGKVEVNNPRTGTFTIYTGIFVKFTQKFSLGLVGGKDFVDFRSESFLGREPTRVETFQQICSAMINVTGGGCSTHATLDDNGG